MAFDFVIEKLAKVDPLIKPMFGCHALYVETKIILLLRKKENQAADNGVRIATNRDHHESLRKQFPSMRSIKLFGKPESEWQVLPENSHDFEESVMTLCDANYAMISA